LFPFLGATTNFSKEWLRLLTNFQFEESKQSYCFEENGQIFGENIDLKVKPASVTKLYTTLWALDELGHDYRFITRFAIKNNDLYILGGLDPYFVTENLIVMITKLNQLGYDSFKNVYFDSAFYLNWSDDFRFIREKNSIGSSILPGGHHESTQLLRESINLERKTNKLH
jgi:hypothetical protein